MPGWSARSRSAPPSAARRWTTRRRSARCCASSTCRRPDVTPVFEAIMESARRLPERGDGGRSSATTGSVCTWWPPGWTQMAHDDAGSIRAAQPGHGQRPRDPQRPGAVHRRHASRYRLRPHHRQRRSAMQRLLAAPMMKDGAAIGVVVCAGLVTSAASGGAAGRPSPTRR